MKFLRSLQADRLIAQLVAFREHDEPDARKAISKLSALGDASVPKVIDALADASRTQTVTFVQILSEQLTNSSLPHYMTALAHENRRVVAGVAWALTSGAGFDPNRLLPLLEEPDVSKATLLEVLSAHKSRLNVRELFNRVYELQPNEKSACMKLIGEVVTDDMVPDLISRVSGKDALVRAHIAKILARFPRPDVQDALQRQLSDKSKLVRQAALSALASMGGGMDIASLCRLLTDPEIDVQNKAIEVIIRVNHPDTMNYLVDVLKDESEYSRRAAVEVLNAIGDTDSIKDLLGALQDDDWWVRSRATDALAKIGGPRVVDAVLELIRDEDEAIRRAAIEILNTTKDTRAVRHLVAATRDPDWWVRERAVDALAEMGDKSVVTELVPMLEQHAKSIPVVVRALAQLGDYKLTTPFLKLLERPESDIRIEAMHGLVKIADATHAQAISEAVAPLAGSDDTEVREQAMRAIADLDERFSATAIAANIKAEKMAEPAKTMLIEANEKEAIAEAASRPPTLDLSKLKPGDVIEQRYKFIQQIGRGAFGTVILVEDTVVDERMVLKFLNSHIASDQEMLQRFVHELRYSRKITHKNVIRIYDFLNLSGLYAISMEYFPSHTLNGALAGKDGLKVERALRIARDIANGMSMAHQVGIVHRDLKPANVLINNDELVKVVDFGVAAAQSGGDTQLTKTGFVIGSPKYMAPEQILGKKVDQRADIYSLGVILYELLCGKPPYTEGDHMSVMYQHVQGDAPGVSTVNKKVPEAVDELVKKAMAIDKLERFQTMDELRQAIEALGVAA
ncbi:MAG: HEAT repeat domain-containing protein [Pseudomonadota bacterium]